MTTGFLTAEIITLPTAPLNWTQQEEQVMRRSVEQYFQQLRVDMYNVNNNAAPGIFTGQWRFSTGLSGDPGAGYAGYNNATPASVTEVRVSETTDLGVDAQLLMALVQVGSYLMVQSKNDSTSFQIFEITAISDDGDYRTYDVTLVSTQGSGFGNNERLVIGVSTSGAAVGGVFWAANGNDIYNTNSGNVGIGTDTPGSSLDIERNGAAIAVTDTNITPSGRTQLALTNNGNVQLSMANTLNTDWVINAGLRWFITANGTELLRIDENGNIGIKTNSPEGDLDVYADTTAATIQVHGDAVPAQLRIKSDDENRRIVALDESNTVMNQIAFEDDSVEIYGATTSVQLGTFLTSGYVGFGTNNPTRRLEVASTEQIVAHVRSTSTAAAYLTLAEADTSNQSQVGIGALGDALALRAAGGNHMTLVGEGDFKATAYGNIIPTMARCDVTADALGSGNNTIVLDSFASGLGINTNGDYALASNEIEVPTDGVYRVTVSLNISATGGTITLMTAQLNINGSSSSGGVQYAGAVEYQAGASLGYFPAHMSDMLELSAGDEISVTVNVTGSGSPTAVANGSVFVERVLGT